VVGFRVGTPAPGDLLADAHAFAGVMWPALHRSPPPSPPPPLDDLLAELARDPAAARPRLVVRSAAPLPAGGLVAAAFVLGRKAALRDPCGGADATIAGLWDDSTRSRTREAFHRTGRPYADETFGHVDGLMRQRLTDWAHAHRDACEAT